MIYRNFFNEIMLILINTFRILCHMCFNKNILYTIFPQLPVQYREVQAGQSSLHYGFLRQIVAADLPGQVLLLASGL